MFDQQEHAKVRSCLERTVELEPDYADAWAVLANIYAQEHRFGFNPRPELYEFYERSLTAAYRAVEIEPRNATAQLMLANVLFDRRNLVGFKAAGERAIALNPNDPEPLVHFGSRLVYMGEWERGVALVTKAIALNPEHPQWYLDPIIYYYYQTGDYERALTESQRQRLSDDVWNALFRAMILGQLSRREEAQPLIEAALKLEPNVRERLFDMARIWNVPDPQIEHIADGLRKAGLAIEPRSGLRDLRCRLGTDRARMPSGARRVPAGRFSGHDRILPPAPSLRPIPTEGSIHSPRVAGSGHLTPRRSRRALLTHRALTSGHDVEPPVGIGVPQLRAGQPTLRDPHHLRPRQPVPLAPPPEAAQPVPEHVVITSGGREPG